MGGSSLAKDKGNPVVRINMDLKGDHARALQDFVDRGVVSSYAEGIRFIVSKYIETIDCPVLLVMVDGIKMEEETS